MAKRDSIADSVSVVAAPRIGVSVPVVNTMFVKNARADYKLLERRLNNTHLPPVASNRGLSMDEIKRAHSRKQGRNQVLFRKGDVVDMMMKEVVRLDDGGSPITRSALKMTDQALIAAEILEKATSVVEDQLIKFNRVADSALDETKKRVSQLTDYNNRLTTAFSNLNKTLGDEKMVRALENADRIANALSLLDELEKKGSLQKIMDALK